MKSPSGDLGAKLTHREVTEKHREWIKKAYVYDFENIGESYLRNKINLPEIRIQYFGEFNYEEIVIKSAISYLKNDVACILKKGSKNEVL